MILSPNVHKQAKASAFMLKLDVMAEKFRNKNKKC